MMTITTISEFASRIVVEVLTLSNHSLALSTTVSSLLSPLLADGVTFNLSQIPKFVSANADLRTGLAIGTGTRA